MESTIIHCIHDPARKDRFDLLQKEIETQGLAVQYWPAIKDPLRRVFVGISQAHKQIVRWAMEQELPEVRIMEDDCFFFSPGAWDYYLEKTPLDYDLYLGNIFHGLQPDGTATDFCGMTLYTVSSRFYQTFLDVNEMNHIDRALAGKGRYAVCDPMVCSQQPGFSDNKLRYDSYERYLDGKRLFGISSPNL